MTVARSNALATLPRPVSSRHVQSVAETILRTAKVGERDPKVLERVALLFRFRLGYLLPGGRTNGLPLDLCSRDLHRLIFAGDCRRTV